MPPETTKQVALILSTMRSGSTLLKALLSAPDDVANLPETDFQKFRSADAASRVAALAREPIIVLKRPAWFHETQTYPKLPNLPGARRVILTRDAHANTLSLRKMVFRRLEPYAPAAANAWLARRYWAPVYTSLLERFPHSDLSSFWIRYEDLVADPVRWTARLFEFIGSRQREGIDAYPKPGGYEWKWGTDDGGQKIKSLKVQPNPIPAAAAAILDQVKNLPEVAATRAALGYAARTR